MNAVYLPYTPGQELWYFELASSDLSYAQIRLGKAQGLRVDEQGKQYIRLAAEPIGVDQPVVNVPIENVCINLYELLDQLKRTLNHIDTARHERHMASLNVRWPPKTDPVTPPTDDRQTCADPTPESPKF